MKRYKNAFKRLKDEIGRISEIEGNAKLFLYMDAAWCFLRYGITPNEYLGWNCWKYSNQTLKTFYTARTSARYEVRFNSPHVAHFFDNKVDFNRKFSEFIKRDWLYTEEHTKEVTVR